MKLKLFALSATIACLSLCASAQKAAWVNFNGGEDVRNIAVDSRNIYVTLAWANRMIAIDKASGEMKAIKADGTITWATVARDRCFYNVAGSGLYAYNAETGESFGPFETIDPSSDETLEIASSPDGRYIYCNSTVLDLNDGSVTYAEVTGHPYAINNEGGVFSACPEVYYTPLNGEKQKLSLVGTSCQSFSLIGDLCYYCFDQGLRVSPVVPDGSMTDLSPSYQTDMNRASTLIRLDEGIFAVSTNMEGLGIGGKEITDPFKMIHTLKTGVKDAYGNELTYTFGNDALAADGRGNLIVGSKGYACILIYNPDGISGYTALKGKATRF